jgi:hypothetical protein
MTSIFYSSCFVCVFFVVVVFKKKEAGTILGQRNRGRQQQNTRHLDQMNGDEDYNITDIVNQGSATVEKRDHQRLLLGPRKMMILLGVYFFYFLSPYSLSC